MQDLRQAIAAITTAPGRGAVGIVRVSGTGLGEFVRLLLGRDLAPRVATYLPFPDAAGQALDQGLALWFPAPHSYTGEDILELQAHGGPVLLQMLLDRCLQVGANLSPALRLAEPGEFSQRAFLNDKIDLAQAEAISDLINAATEGAARSAARSLTGEFSAAVHSLLHDLTHLRMVLEANLDFPEEEDVGDLASWGVPRQLHAIQDGVARIFASARQGQLLRDGLKVVIAGQPNAGKSSLLNALAQAEVAIVTPIAGTTRDKIEQSIQIEGVPLHIIDTAGLRESADVVEQIGVERAWAAIASADVLLFVHDLARSQPAHAEHSAYKAQESTLAAQLAGQLPAHTPVLHIWNKSDCVDAAAQQAAVAALPHQTGQAENTILLSTKTQAGLADLRQRLLHIAGWQSLPEGVFAARERHLQALREVASHLQTAQAQLQHPPVMADLMAEDLRLAQNALSSITGEFSADDLLGVIFSSFCIGK
jgi:tRNA modification GTPase